MILKNRGSFLRNRKFLQFVLISALLVCYNAIYHLFLKTGEIMKRSIKSYIPEDFFTAAKHTQSVRRCFEDLVIVDPADRYRAVTWRCHTDTKGGRFLPKREIEASEFDFLERTLPFSDRAVLADRSGRAVLVWADLLQSAGVLVFMRPHLSAGRVALALGQMERRDLPLSPRMQAQEKPAKTLDTTENSILAEQLFYMDRIMKHDISCGIWAHSVTVANFVGCFLKRVSPGIDRLLISDTDAKRLTAFLLCAFLSLRRRDGSYMAADASLSDTPTVLYRAEQEELAEYPMPNRQEDLTQFPFLQAHGMRDFHITQTPNGLILEAFLHQETEREQSLYTHPSPYVCLRIGLEETMA